MPDPSSRDRAERNSASPGCDNNMNSPRDISISLISKLVSSATIASIERA